MSRGKLGPGREFDLIEEALAGASALREGVVRGWGDDAAVVDASPLAVSTDLSVEGVHFRTQWMTPWEIGYRATCAGISDLAAMAAEPVGALLSVAVAPERAEREFGPLVAGARAAVEAYGGVLLGGDLSRVEPEGPLVVDVVALGVVAGAGCGRDGGRPGDGVWVTGVLGGAGGAVATWSEGLEPGPELRAAFVRPTPRVREALWLRERSAVHALMDISDGIGGDLGHLAAASGLDIDVTSASVPLHPSLASLADAVATTPLRLALEGGEDYELALLGPDEVLSSLAAEFAETFGVPLTRIGECAPGSGTVRIDGRPRTGGGFDHFGRRP